VVEGLLNALHLNPDDLRYERANHSTFHPGRSAEVFYGQKPLGYLGELHPIVAQNFELTDAPVMVAEFDLDAILMASVENHRIDALPTTPPLLQDIALVVTEQTAAADVERLIWRIGGKLLRDVKLFDVYRGDPIPAGQKSLAYNLVYGAPDRTLTDKDVAKVHQSIVKVAEKELGARLRA
jgi:phenylalanyl-tRNA synthetase beta chain